MIDRALLDVGEAAKYLGVSRSYFDDHLRALLPIVDMKAPGQKQPMWRFTKADLDAFIESRRRERKAS